MISDIRDFLARPLGEHHWAQAQHLLFRPSLLSEQVTTNPRVQAQLTLLRRNVWFKVVQGCLHVMEQGTVPLPAAAMRDAKYALSQASEAGLNVERESDRVDEIVLRRGWTDLLKVPERFSTRMPDTDRPTKFPF